jgi:hypothetical protein
VFGLLARLG